MADTDLSRTPLYDLHVSLGAKMVPFAGYAMPVQYPTGILAEHEHTRTGAGLFDVSHMGQVAIRGTDPAAAFETLVPGDIASLAPGRMRYSMFTNAQGGILDDLMALNRGDHLHVVVNAACKADDIAHMKAALEPAHSVIPLADRCLLALQGPAAATVLARFLPEAATMPFMSAIEGEVAGMTCLVTRSGYTGEDGYELSAAEGDAERLAKTLLGEGEVKPIGLGARDSLRLEAGLCLYGHDIDTTTTPIEAALAWTIGKRRREVGGFPGADVILGQLRDGAARRRVGIRPEGRVIAREGTVIVDEGGTEIGVVTSGGFGPSAGGPVAMGYVAKASAAPGTKLGLMVRGQARPAEVVRMPFVETQYFKG